MAEDTPKYSADTLTPEQKAEYAALNAEFQSLLSPDAGFDYNAWLGNQMYRDVIEHRVGRDPARADAKRKALDKMLEFWKKISVGSAYEQSGGPVTPEDLFSGVVPVGSEFSNPLKKNIEQYAAQARQRGTADINAGSAQSQKRAAEGIAGTGLGRSGAAAGGFQSIENTRQSAVDRLLGRVSDYETQAKMEVDKKMMELNLSEALRKRGMNAQEIQASLSFWRSIDYMKYQSLTEMSQDSQKDFWDTWGTVIGAGIGAGSQIGAAAAMPA